MSGKGFLSRINGGSSITPLLQPSGETCSNALTTKGNIVVASGSKVAASTIKSTGGPAYKENTSNTTSKRPLNLTPKQLEKKKIKNQCLWYVSRLKKTHGFGWQFNPLFMLDHMFKIVEKWQFYMSHGSLFQISKGVPFIFF